MKKIAYITAQVPYGHGEAFIIDEMLAIKEAGINLLIIPRNSTKKVFHQEAQSLLPDTIWMPLINFKIIIGFVKSLLTKIPIIGLTPRLIILINNILGWYLDKLLKNMISSLLIIW